MKDNKVETNTSLSTDEWAEMYGTELGSTYVMTLDSKLHKKEFKVVRKEEPTYRKLEKKQGYKGKVKMNKGVARKWYV
jgi:hypothetical protein